MYLIFILNFFIIIIFIFFLKFMCSKFMYILGNQKKKEASIFPL